MKPNKFFSISLALGLLLLSACNKFLDVTPQQSIDPSAAFSSASGVRAGINGCYNVVQGTNAIERQSMFPDMQADNADWTGTFPSWQEIDNYAINPANVETTNMWASAYTLINNCNNVIANVEGKTFAGMTSTERDHIVGEAYALRAYAYHLLVRWWGGVPLVLQPTLSASGLNVPRNTVNEVFTQIRTDLSTAIGLMATAPFTALTRINRNAARALLARVQMDIASRVNFAVPGGAAGATYADVLTTLGTFMAVTPTLPVIGTVQPIAFVNVSNAETIWTVFYSTADQNSMSFWYSAAPNGRRELAPSAGLVAAFTDPFSASTDLRLAATVLSGNGNKYNRVATDDDFVPVVRLADLILLRAEARAETADLPNAIADLNIVRLRAGLIALTAVELPDLATFRIELRRMRRTELALEGHRWHDMFRWNLISTATPTGLGLNVGTRAGLWPIPLRELINNPNMVQNPGY